MDWVIPIVLLGFFAVFIIAQFFGGKAKPNLAAEASEEAADIKAAADKVLKEHLTRVDDERKELDRIKAIENERERLAALAEFGNRRRK